jgi:predicted ATPase
MVLVIEDLHWADGSSLKLLEFMAGEIEQASLLVLGTYRDVDLSRSHPLFVTLGELPRHRLFRRVVLKGLDKEAVGAVIAGAGETPPLSATVEAIYEQTEGNPLFVREVARLLGQEGMLGSGTAGRSIRGFRLPEGVREAIGRRLNTLSPSSNAALRAASVIGNEFGVTLLRKLVVSGPGGGQRHWPGGTFRKPVAGRA